MIWDLTWIEAGDKKISELLAEGWEPFTVINGYNDGQEIYLKLPLYGTNLPKFSGKKYQGVDLPSPDSDENWPKEKLDGATGF